MMGSEPASPMPSPKSDEPSHHERWKAVLAAAFILVLLALTWWWLHPSTGGPITLPIGSGNLTPTPPPSATYVLSSPQENASLTLSSNRSFDSQIYSARVKNTGSTPFNNTALVTLFPESFSPASLQFRQTPPEMQSTFLFTSPVVRATPLNLVPGGEATLSVSTRINFSSEASSPLFLLGNFTFFNDSQTLPPQDNPLLLIASNLSDSPLDENSAGILSAFLSESSLNNEDPQAYPLAVRAIASVQSLPVDSQAQALAGFRFLLLDPQAGDHPSAEERVGNALYYGTLVTRAKTIADAQSAAGGVTFTEAFSQLLGGLYNTMTGAGVPMWKRLAAMDQMLSEKEKQLGISPSSSSGGPSTSPGTQQASANSLFPSLPSRITIVVSETLPQNSTTLPLHSSVDLGYPLARFEGDAAPLLTFTPRKVGTSTEAQISADLSHQMLKGGVLPFDEMDGTMVLGYFSLEAQQARVPVRILISPHTNLISLLGQCGIDIGFDSDTASQGAGESVTVQEALQSMGTTVQCNPLCGASGLIFSSPSTGSASALVDAAASYVGRLPYVWGGTSLVSGADCSGFVQQIYSQYAATAIPRTAAAQFAAGIPIDRTNLQPGDLVFFRNTGGRTGITHVGLFVGSGMFGSCTFINAPGTGQYVKYASLCSPYSSSHYAGARRFISQPATSSSSSTSTTSTTSTLPGAPAPQPTLYSTDVPTASQLDSNGCLASSYYGLAAGTDVARTPLGNTDVRGPPSISADHINAILNQYASPLQNEPGFAQCMLASGQVARIDPAFALAWALQETSLGKAGSGRATSARNLYGMNVGTLGDPSVFTGVHGRYKSYSTYCDSVKDWYAYINRYYVQNRGISKVEQIVPIYAPASDGNCPSCYIKFVTSIVAHWRSQEQAAKSG